MAQKNIILPDLFENRERIFEAVRHAFHDGANQVRARVGSGQSHQRRTSVGVEMWRALAHEIGQPESAFRTGRRRTGLVRENVVRIASGVSLHTGRDAEAISQPAQKNNCARWE